MTDDLRDRIASLLPDAAYADAVMTLVQPIADDLAILRPDLDRLGLALRLMAERADQAEAERDRLAAVVHRVRDAADQLADGTEAGFRDALAIRDALDSLAAPAEEPAGDVASAVLGAEWLRLYRTDPAAAADALARMLPPGTQASAPAKAKQCRAGQNAEDCPPGAHPNLPYPWICPGPAAVAVRTPEQAKYLALLELEGVRRRAKGRAAPTEEPVGDECPRCDQDTAACLCDLLADGQPEPDTMTCERCSDTAPAETDGWQPMPTLCPSCLDSLRSKSL